MSRPRPGVREAIEWLALNDDCHWLGDYDGHGPMLSVSAAMVRDLWQLSDEMLLTDLHATLKRVHPDHPALKEVARKGFCVHGISEDSLCTKCGVRGTELPPECLGKPYEKDIK